MFVSLQFINELRKSRRRTAASVLENRDPAGIEPCEQTRLVASRDDVELAQLVAARGCYGDSRARCRDDEAIVRHAVNLDRDRRCIDEDALGDLGWSRLAARGETSKEPHLGDTHALRPDLGIEGLGHGLLRPHQKRDDEIVAEIVFANFLIGLLADLGGRLVMAGTRPIRG